MAAKYHQPSQPFREDPKRRAQSKPSLFLGCSVIVPITPGALAFSGQTKTGRRNLHTGQHGRAGGASSCLVLLFMPYPLLWDEAVPCSYLSLQHEGKVPYLTSTSFPKLQYGHLKKGGSHHNAPFPASTFMHFLTHFQTF